MSLDDLKFKIKEEILLSQIIGNYIPVIRKGNSTVSLCPFHSDTNPSMQISDSKKLFKCYACGAAGDAISFVMKYKNLDFIDSLKEICSQQGLSFESFQEEKKQNPKTVMGKKILTKTAQLYRKIATDKAQSPFQDFIKKRAISDEIAKTYQLGYSLNRNSLLEYLQSIPNLNEREFALKTAFELSLIKSKSGQFSSEGMWDSFRERIIFPIWDHSGQVIGFTSRAIADHQVPKYMNSKESFLFNKSNLLYGYHLAKNAIREKDCVILVEGNMDQIALYQNGFTHSVAIMGIALGPQSLDRLLSLTKNVILALDSDSAGFKAMMKINQQLAEKGVVSRFIDFQPAKDPDEFLLKFGILELQKKIDAAEAAYDVILRKMIPTKLPEIVDQKLKLLEQAFVVLKPLGDELSAIERLLQFARSIGLNSSSEQIQSKYRQFLEQQNSSQLARLPLRKGQQSSEREPKAIVLQVESDRDAELKGFYENHFFDNTESQHAKPDSLKLNNSEKLCLQELLQKPALLDHEGITEILDLIDSDEVKIYLGKLQKLYIEVDEIEFPKMATDLISENCIELKNIAFEAFYDFKPKTLDTKSKNRIIFDLKIKLERERLRQKREALKNLQSGLETIEESEKLLRDILIIEKNLLALTKAKPDLR